MTDQTRRPSRLPVVLGLSLGFLLLTAAVYAGAYLFTADHVPEGTTVEGIEIGGLSTAQAQRRLDARLVPRAGRRVAVAANGERAVLSARQIDMQVDVPATVDRTGAGTSWDPRRIWAYFSSRGQDVPAVVSVDSDTLDQAIARFATRADVPAVNGTVEFARGTAVPREPVLGRRVQRAASASAVTAALLAEDLPAAGVELPTRTVSPPIDAGAVRRAMDAFARPAVSGPVDVVLGRETVRLTPEEFTPALSVRVVGSQLRPRVDADALIEALDTPRSPIGRRPRDAEVTIRNGRVAVLPSKAGVRFALGTLEGPFLEALTRSGGERRLTVDEVVTQPRLTTAEARGLRITEQVSAFTTNFPHSDYRNTNLGRAAQLIDGTILEPGETFSFNDVVGERTAENGFTKGFIISDGVFREDYGGGVSQVATTTFNAAFFAGLEDVEHKPHSFYIDRYPVGREATVAWPTVDLKFKNTTPYGVLVKASIVPSSPSSQGAMTVTMWSTRYWRIETTTSERYDFTSPQIRRLSGPECVANVGYGGFDVDVRRLFYRRGSPALVREEVIHTTYTPSDTVICS